MDKEKTAKECVACMECHWNKNGICTYKDYCRIKESEDI